MESNLIELSSRFADEEKAIDLIEEVRWADGRICSHCGHGKSWLIATNSTNKKSKRRSYKCASCRKKFSVTVGTIFERSHIPLNKWLATVYLMSSSKKGISAKQIERSVGITYKSAWFLCHRIRHAMGDPDVQEMLTGIVEVDETYVGGKVRNRFGRKRGTGTRGRGAEKKTPVVTLIERDGRVKAFTVPNVGKGTLRRLIRENVEITADIMTDKFQSYSGLDKHFKSHQTVDHAKTYVRGIVHTNFAESYFSLFKRGIMGAFHHISEGHMDRYLAEFNFRWNSRKMGDVERMRLALSGFDGKRLLYRHS